MDVEPLNYVVPDDYYPDRDAYHRDGSRDSHHSLEDFRASVRKYYRKYVLKKQHDKPTKEMEFGSALHKAVLEPDTFLDVYAVATRDYGDSKKDVRALNEFAAANPGRIVLNKSDWDKICELNEAISDDTEADHLLREEGKCEEMLHWQFDDGSGLMLPMRSCLDKVLLSPGIIVDIKTTRGALSRDWLSKTIADYGYHRQAVTYLRAASLVWHQKFVFKFVFVSKDCPEACTVTLPREDQVLAWNEVRANVSDLLSRKTMDYWDSRWKGEVNEVGLPAWYRKRKDQ